MKKNILYFTLFIGISVFNTLKAQETNIQQDSDTTESKNVIQKLKDRSSVVSKYTYEDVNPLLQYINKEKDIRITAGARLMADLGYFHSDYTPMKSGAGLVDARIRVSLMYKKLYFYADMDFGGGIFKQRNIFIRYNFLESVQGIHSLKFGFYAEPGSMAFNTSSYDYHFITRPIAVTTLTPPRQLGITYKFYNTKVLFDQGIFAENPYNNQIAGFQGFTLNGRWVYKIINNPDYTLHIGASARWARIYTGQVINNVLTTNLHLTSPLETALDLSSEQFLNTNIPYVRDNINVQGELLFRTKKFFARGEYIHKWVMKKRPDRELFDNQLGADPLAVFATLPAWQAGNPIRNNNFNGAYAEVGYLILGKSYNYNDELAVIRGMNDNNSLEIVARYSYLSLNDIAPGDNFFFVGRGQYYNANTNNGGIQIPDYPATSTSVVGGRVHIATIGLNYTFNQYIKLLGEYSYCNLDNKNFPYDKNFHMLQMRLMFAF